MNRKYGREFRLEAVRLAQEAGTTALEVEERPWDKGMVSRWKRQLVQQGRRPSRAGATCVSRMKRAASSSAGWGGRPVSG
jgi:transposase-like protein